MTHLDIPALQEPITEAWLKEVGFRWHQLDRQPTKHWLLWLGDAHADSMTSHEDIGMEIASGALDDRWFCWLRSDTSHLYHRFLHIRHISTRAEVVQLVEAMTGQSWNPDNHIGGSVRQPQHAERMRVEASRFDRVLRRTNPKWQRIEHDDSRGGALPEHLEAFERQRGGTP